MTERRGLWRLWQILQHIVDQKTLHGKIINILATTSLWLIALPPVLLLTAFSVFFRIL